MRKSNNNKSNKLKHMRLFLIVALLSIVFPAHSSTYQERPTEYPTYSAFVNDISIAYQDFGDPKNDAILLVMGLGGQLIHWDDDLVFKLVDEGYRVIRFDNRDAGWSQKFYQAPTPGLVTGIRFKLGLSLNSPYKLDDMAADAYALLEYLNVERAHVVGLSMGGMIAQIMAAKYTDRVVSLTSIMSTTSAKHLPAGSIELQPRADKQTREGAIESSVSVARLIDGSVAELSDEQWRKQIARGYDRAHYTDGFDRQLWAILDSGDRVALLNTVKQPTVVIHGTEDTLIPHAAGEHTAEQINGAKLVLIEGMGHYLDQVSKPKVIREILSVAAQAAR